MKIKISFTILILSCLIGFSAYSQDIHFSQFYASPLTLNPANTGNYEGDWRFMNNFRRQWGAFASPAMPYQTISVGIDKPFFIKDDKFCIGAVVLNDNSGEAKLTVNKVYASLAYQKVTSKATFHFGAQGGYVMKSYSMDQLTFPSQYDNTSGYYNTGLSNNEPTSLGDEVSYVDVNAGAGVTLHLKNFTPYVTLALFHLNSPNESYSSQKNKLSSRKVLNVGGRLLLNPKVFVQPNYLFMNQAAAQEMLFGSNLGYIIPNKQSKVKNIFAGAYFRDGFKRNPDAFVAVIGANLFNFDLGLSYDVNVSQLRAITNYKGGWEISIIYTAPSTRLTKITIPCDRF